MGPFNCRSNGIQFLVVAASFFLCFQIIDAVSPNANNKVCQSEACKNIATSILQKMNQSVNPCDNFYEFVCGNFSRNAVIPSVRSSIDLVTQLGDLVLDQLKDDVENKITDKDPETFQKLLKYYKTCMDEDQIEKTSCKEFLDILKQLGGWPVLLGKSYIDSKFDWKDTIKTINRMGYEGNYIISTNFYTDSKNTTRKRIYLSQPDFAISQEYLTQGLDNDVVKAYFKYMVDFAEIFGADREQAKRDLRESLNFEIALAKISLPFAKLRDPEKNYNPMNISELQRNYPSIPWLQYLNDQMNPFYQVTEDEVVIVVVPTFLQKLGRLLADTSKRVLSNFLMWQVAYDSADQLNQKVRDITREFNAVLSGNSNEIPRWRTCLNVARDNLRLATSSLYVKRNFDKASKDAAVKMVERLRQSFINIVSEVNWMDETTKSTALEKLKATIAIIGYFDELLDDEKINNYYKDLNIYPESYLKTTLSYNQFTRNKTLKQYRDPNPRIDWTTFSSDVVNAFSSQTSNAIDFPAAILQGDFYNKNYPVYVNLASIGSVMGHEMSHQLDDQGSHFNKRGNLVNWWKADTKKKYLERAECMIDQYSSYIQPQVGLHVNGNLTIGENIADNAGLKEAYLAYVAFEKENGVEPNLPGFEGFTSRQLFWISFANVHCTKYRTEYLRNLVITNPHSPEPFRVIGTTSNNPYFAQDFKCPLGSPMNPEKKCIVW